MFFLCRENDFPWGYLRVTEGVDLSNLILPRKTVIFSFKNRVDVLLRCFRISVGKIYLGVLCCVDELCPGGQDILDGVLILKSLERCGVRFIIIDDGTVDFSTLKVRKLHSKKYCLSSLGFLKNRLSISIFVRHGSLGGRWFEHCIFKFGGAGIMFY